jgi:hypothetical protein
MGFWIQLDEQIHVAIDLGVTTATEPNNDRRWTPARRSSVERIAWTFQLSCGSMTAKASAKTGTGPSWLLRCSSAVARWRAFADLLLIPLNPTPVNLRGPNQRIDVVQTALTPIAPRLNAPGAITATTEPTAA